MNEVIATCREDYRTFLYVQKELVNRYFSWLKLSVKGKVLEGTGMLDIYGHRYEVQVIFSPFFDFRFDRIYIKGITYHKKIHLYSDTSLCLYHPMIDMPIFKTMPLVAMIPWITEWCIHYEEWKKYGVWLGKEITH